MAVPEIGTAYWIREANVLFHRGVVKPEVARDDDGNYG